MSISDKHYNHITEVMYGDEYTKDDKQNVKKKFKPVVEEKTGFTIREPSHACRFIENYTDLLDELDRMYEVNATLRNNIKNERKKKDHYIRDSVFENFHKLSEEHSKLKEEYNKLKDDKIQDYNTHPYCIRLVQERDTWKNQAINFKSKHQSEKDYVESRRKEYDSYLEHKSEIEDKLHEDFEKKKASFIRKAKQENKDEESVKMKALKDEVASLKKKITKYDKKNKVLKKDNKKLRIQVAEMSSDDSDSDSDSDTD